MPTTPSIRALTLSALLLCASPGRAATELIDPAALGFGRPAFTLDTTVQGTLDYEDGRRGLETFELRALAPVAKWKIGDWLVGASVKYSWTQADFGQFGGLGTKDLHTAEVQVFAGWQVKDSPWWALGFITPGIASDFEDLGGDSVTASGLALLGYRWSDRLDLAVGVFASYGLSEVSALGAVGFIWRPDDHWVVQATPPIVAIGWTPDRDWTFGVVTYPGGGGWEVGGQDDAVRQVDLSLWRAALSVERKIGDHWRVSVRGGVSFGGELELRDSEERVLTSSDLDPAPFGAVAVKWTF